ncbi:hypothetical protein VE01_10780 [Pseudogymnoascus verrucosus]|uniref:Uncharacterized protein n=1 Tax=Pseudogymnoascus verrucosus TaxID=342668 RepID=A0A2P6FGW5_9PEZI|nr:uncharacterized protein VE01_10780 [Pseudogymnoascus verrucosus]PQM43884.1 hypothetical protein VE01_10780 [Pseudogymnoascus verrucosus]
MDMQDIYPGTTANSSKQQHRWRDGYDYHLAIHACCLSRWGCPAMQAEEYSRGSLHILLRTYRLQLHHVKSTKQSILNRTTHWRLEEETMHGWGENGDLGDTVGCF